MNINGIGVNKINNIYTEKNKKVTDKKPIDVNNDSVQISSLGKSLNAYSLEDNFTVSRQDIDKIKSQISNGTYNIDSTAIASKMMDAIKGGL
jgi:negative regulator of flagellin synthesis FlgM